jgi:hypothetical protein
MGGDKILKRRSPGTIGALIVRWRPGAIPPGSRPDAKRRDEIRTALEALGDLYRTLDEAGRYNCVR